MGNYPIWVYCVLLLLLICLESSVALTEGEKTAVLDFYQTWPGLGHLSPPWSANASLACDDPPFKGLECSEGPEKHIVSLTTTGWNTPGSIPDSIGNLIWLKTLSIDGTVIPSIPDTIGKLVDLEVLSIDHAGLSDLPNSVDQLTHLTSFRLVESTNTGRFPELKSKRLSTFHLEGFAGSGPIPSSFCDLESLEFLTLQSLDSSGFEECQEKLAHLQSILFSNLPQMRDLTTDSLMAGRPNMSSIEVVQHISVSGRLWPLPNLKVIKLSGTGLSGHVDALWEAPELTVVDIRPSSLTGAISSRIGNLSKLSHLDLSSSLISGSIPPEIGRCTQLKELILHNALLTGFLPP